MRLLLEDNKGRIYEILNDMTPKRIEQSLALSVLLKDFKYEEKKDETLVEHNTKGKR